MRDVSWTQLFIVLACFAAIGVAHFTGPYQGTIVSAVVGLILWLQRPPPGPPPAALKAVAGLVIGFGIGHFIAGCAPNQLTPQDETNLATFAAEIALCNSQPDPVACKQAVKQAFDAQRAAQFDGGYVAPDGGVL